MERMRQNKVFDFKHPLIKYTNHSIILLWNIVSWNKHMEHLLGDPIYLEASTIFCFTETKQIHSDKGIKNFHPDWQDQHSSAQHGVCISFNTNKLELIE